MYLVKLLKEEAPGRGSSLTCQAWRRSSRERANLGCFEGGQRAGGEQGLLKKRESWCGAEVEANVFS